MSRLPIKTGHMFIGIAVILGLGTTFVYTSSGKKEPVAQKVQTVETAMVVVPQVNISKGQTLGRDDVIAVKWPKAYLPKGVTFDDPLEVVGRIAKQPLYPGEPIYSEKVSGSDTKGGLPAMIPDGMRAVTVGVTEVKGVAGFVKPGDRVDVMTTFELDGAEGGADNRVTRTVLQNVLVLASAQTMVDENEADLEVPEGVTRGEATTQVAVVEDKKSGKKAKTEDKPKSEKELEKERKARRKEKMESEKRARLVSSVTVAVTPEQSVQLALAEETGDIRLALRAENDHALSEIPAADFARLFGGSRLPVAAVASPPSLAEPSGTPLIRYGTSVELIQGTEKSNVGF